MTDPRLPIDVSQSVMGQADTIDVAPTSTEPGVAPKAEKPRSLGRDAWDELRKNKVVIVASLLILVLVVMAIWPQLFTSKDPTYCNGDFTRQAPSAKAWFGYDLQGCDVYARTIHGARASILVGVLTMVMTVIVGTSLGLLAGYYGGKLDTLVSRAADIFFSIPYLLGTIIVLTSLPSGETGSFWLPLFKVVLALTALGWPSMMRVMRSAVIQIKQADYVLASRATGASGMWIMRKHILPNAIQPVIVIATIALGGYIAAEATLSFLGVGLQSPTVSWGIAISDAQNLVRVAPHMLLFPSLFLSVTVLAFIMLGDAVRDALDPKLR